VRKEKKQQKTANKQAQQQKSKKILSKADVFIKPIEDITVQIEEVKLQTETAHAPKVDKIEEENDGNEEFSEQQLEVSENKVVSGLKIN